MIVLSVVDIIVLLEFGPVFVRAIDGYGTGELEHQREVVLRVQPAVMLLRPGSVERVAVEVEVHWAPVTWDPSIFIVVLSEFFLGDNVVEEPSFTLDPGPE
jgi:hypothetical protein